MIPTVLLHGFLGAPSSWEAVTSALSPAGERVALALPGHGPAPWTLEPGAAFDDVVDAFAKRLPARAHFVGYSMGARTLLGLLARHPDRVASLVAVGLHAGLEEGTERAVRRAWDEELARDLESKDLAGFVDAWESLPLFASQRDLPMAVRARRRAERLAHVPSALAWAQRALGLGTMPPLEGALASSAAPIHLVTGARDEKFTAHARAIVVRAGGSGPRHTVVPGVGHDVGLEAPHALAEIVRATESEAGAGAVR